MVFIFDAMVAYGVLNQSCLRSLISSWSQRSWSNILKICLTPQYVNSSFIIIPRGFIFSTMIANGVLVITNV